MFQVAFALGLLAAVAHAEPVIVVVAPPPPPPAVQAQPPIFKPVQVFQGKCKDGAPTGIRPFVCAYSTYIRMGDPFFGFTSAPRDIFLRGRDEKVCLPVEDLAKMKITMWQTRACESTTRTSLDWDVDEAPAAPTEDYEAVLRARGCPFTLDIDAMAAPAEVGELTLEALEEMRATACRRLPAPGRAPTPRQQFFLDNAFCGGEVACYTPNAIRAIVGLAQPDVGPKDRWTQHEQCRALAMQKFGARIFEGFLLPNVFAGVCRKPLPIDTWR